MEMSPISTNIDLTNAKEMSCGYHHNLILLNDGTVLAWGRNNYGQLGIGDLSKTKVSTPIKISGLTNVKQLAAGSFHVLALLNDGTVKVWGQNSYGQLGIGKVTDLEPSPIILPELNNVKTVMGGNFNSAAILNDGRIKIWGSNHYGIIGNGTIANVYYSTPLTLPYFKHVGE